VCQSEQRARGNSFGPPARPSEVIRDQHTLPVSGHEGMNDPEQNANPTSAGTAVEFMPSAMPPYSHRCTAISWSISRPYQAARGGFVPVGAGVDLHGNVRGRETGETFLVRIGRFG
jgi:hypothetical protein